jgi:hypothetical protein
VASRYIDAASGAERALIRRQREVADLTSLGLVVSSTPAMRKRPPTRKRPRDGDVDADELLHGVVCAMPWTDDFAAVDDSDDDIAVDGDDDKEQEGREDDTDDDDDGDEEDDE